MTTPCSSTAASIGPFASRSTRRKRKPDSGCMSCHAIVHVGGSMGNADFTVEYPPLHELASSPNRFIQALDRFLIYLNPKPHRATFLEAVHARANRGVLRLLSQSALGRTGEQLSMGARIRRLRQLAGQRRLGPGRALVLLSDQVADLRGLSHAAGGVARPRQPRRPGALASFPGRKYGRRVCESG